MAGHRPTRLKGVQDRGWGGVGAWVVYSPVTLGMPCRRGTGRATTTPRLVPTISKPWQTSRLVTDSRWCPGWRDRRGLHPLAWPLQSTGWSRAPEPPTSPEHYQTGRCHRGPGHTGERQGASWLYSCQMGSYEPGTLLSTAGQHFQGQAKPQTIQETIHFLPGPHTHPSHGSPASRAHLDRYKETRMAPLAARAQQHSPCRSREGTAPGTGRDLIIQALGNTDRKH